MKQRMLALLVICCLAAPVTGFALSGKPKAEFDQFIKSLREEKRLDRIGYLVMVRVKPSKANETKIISLAGKYFYACPEGYLTHVNYTRLDKMQKAKIKVKIINKKRLDDLKEAWYMVWINDDTQDKILREKFEPLFTHGHTRVIRIQPEDEEFLTANLFRYSILEEALLPLKVLDEKVIAPRVELDPKIQELILKINKTDMTSTVQTLENFRSRQVRETGNARATNWLAGEFAKIGSLTVATPTFNYNSGPLSNVVATQKGTKDPNTVIVVCGHFDSTTSYGSKDAPGADDNGTGAAGVLHVASVAGRLPLPFTVMYCCMNAEEVGLVGSKAIAKKMAATEGLKIKAVLNMDMIADRDDNQVAVIGNSKSNWLIDVFKDVAKFYTGIESKPLYDSDIWYSDHSSFWNIGASAILTIEGYPEMSAHYHKPTDLVANLDPALMERIARSNLATLLTLDSEKNK